LETDIFALGASSMTGGRPKPAPRPRGDRARDLFLISSLSLPLVFASVPSPRPARADEVGAASRRPFVTVSGARFLEGDRPFAFVGANLNVLHGPDARAGAIATLDAAAKDGLRVARIWALGEGPADALSWQRKDFLFRAGPDTWQEEAFRQLDLVVAEAGRRNLRLIVTLSNAWKDYGGVPTYLRWAGHVDVESYGYFDRFFTDEKCRTWFAEHLRHVVGRTNARTGVPYRDDPTILAWELQNEMNGTPEGAAARRRWVTEMTARIRALDHHHLVVPGLIGYSLKSEREEWVRMCRLPEVAYCDQHVYPEEHLRTRGAANLARTLDDRVQLAHHVVGKPIVLGEFGFDEKGSTAARAALHRQLLDRFFHDGGDGALVWIYQTTLGWKRTYPILVDQRRHDPIRRALAAVAARVAAHAPRNQNPRIGPRFGDRPIAPTHALLEGTRAPHRGWTASKDGATRRLEIPVEAFARGWFEEGGSWDGGILMHAYGRQTGWFEYAFVGPGEEVTAFEIRARLSSEFPGKSAPPGGTSRVRVSLDGKLLDTVRAIPDDGVGAWVTVTVRDEDLLARLARGVHALRFEVVDGPEANGVAIYGGETRLNREPVEDPGPLRLEARVHPRAR
jgi:hypothetical protein